MSPAKNRFNGPVLAFAGLVLCVFAYQTNAMRSIKLMQPTVIATIDLEAVFKQLDRVGVAEKALEAEILKLIDSKTAMEENIKNLQADLEDFPPGSEKYKEIEDRLMRAAFKLRAEVEFNNGLRVQRNADIVREIYLEISEAAKLVAQANGVDIVFVDDSILQINPGTLIEVNRQIAARRMLYANPTINLTVDVINLMN